MIRSMTGFGDAARVVAGVHFAVELRAVNHRYFKCTVRLAEELAGMEPELESLLRAKVSRGSFALSFQCRAAAAAAVSRVNDDALMSYLDHLETIQARVASQHSDPSVRIDLAQLMALPGVLAPAEDPEAVTRRAREAAPGLIDEAVAAMDRMRRAEGQGLAEELDRQLVALDGALDAIRERAPSVVQEYHDRLLQRVRELTASAKLELSRDDLAREVAIYAERSDIAEEVQRLAGHVEQFREQLAGDEPAPVGRTLDFLAQEMLREANTIGSKSNDGRIARRVVELKSSIDRIKEQVQNVE